MLRVTVEMVSFGQEELAHPIDVLYIGKVNEDYVKDTADYVVYVNEDPRQWPKDSRPKPDLTITGHKRENGYGPLLSRIFEEVGVR